MVKIAVPFLIWPWNFFFYLISSIPDNGLYVSNCHRKQLHEMSILNVFCWFVKITIQRTVAFNLKTHTHKEKVMTSFVLNQRRSSHKKPF